MQNNPRSIQPEPDQESTFAKNPITNLIHSFAQQLACGAQENKEEKDSDDKKPGFLS